MLHSLLLPASLVAASLLVKSPLAAEESAPQDTTQEEVVLRILELRQEIEDLLEALPPELRGEVERRWQEHRAAETDTTPPAPTLVAPLAATEIAVEPEKDTKIEIMEGAKSTDRVEPPCAGFHLLDTDRDALVSAGDRQWRYLRLWFDNGNGKIEESEIESLLDLGVREIEVGLDSYSDTEGDAEDIDGDGYIYLRMLGKGGEDKRSGVLIIETDRLAKDGVLALTDLEGSRLSGYQPLGAATLFETQEGQQIPVFCPEKD